MTCEHYDCGWCYNPTAHREDGNTVFACSGTDKCPLVEFTKEDGGLDRIAALRVDLYDCMGKPPRDYIQPVAPANAMRSAWIPQTMGDQIWVLYEFSSEATRLAWEALLPAEVSRWLDRKLLPHAMKYGWKTRDANGFPVD